MIWVCHHFRKHPYRERFDFRLVRLHWTCRNSPWNSSKRWMKNMESRLEEKPNHPAVYPNRFTPYPPTPPPPKKNAAKQQQKLGGGFKYLLFSPILFWGRCPIWHAHIFSNGLVQPPHIKITDSLSGVHQISSLGKKGVLHQQMCYCRCLRFNQSRGAPQCCCGEVGLDGRVIWGLKMGKVFVFFQSWNWGVGWNFMRILEIVLRFEVHVEVRPHAMILRHFLMKSWANLVLGRHFLFMMFL